MKYIIFDLEWNNAYNYKLKKGMNEIIEIGAVKLDEKLNIVDTFKQLIKPRLSKKLRSSFKNLTHITMDEIRANGVDFDVAFADFSRWCGDGDLLFLSWSTSDLHTLAENYKKFRGSANVSFIRKYADAQKYCMRFLDDAPQGNQISLSNCAEKFDIKVDTENLHRALEDCYVTAHCFRKVYDKAILEKYISDCNCDYFERLIFKPYFINERKCNGFNLEEVQISCEHCKKPISRIKDYEFQNNTFKSIGKCPQCGKTFWIYVRAKQTYDGIKVSARAVEMNKRRARKINN